MQIEKQITQDGEFQIRTAYCQFRVRKSWHGRGLVALRIGFGEWLDAPGPAHAVPFTRAERQVVEDTLSKWNTFLAHRLGDEYIIQTFGFYIILGIDKRGELPKIFSQVITKTRYDQILSGSEECKIKDIGNDLIDYLRNKIDRVIIRNRIRN